MQQEQSQTTDVTSEVQVKRPNVIYAPTDPGEDNICIGCE